MARILVIEDDAHIRALIRERLECAEHEVDEAPDGLEGTKTYRERPSDLIITDVIMPRKEGMETILDLKREFPDVKIIAISGGGSIGPNLASLPQRRHLEY